MSELGNHQARKRFGQNFLVDEQIISRIVAAIAPKPDDNMVEIGPGQGAITELVLERCPGLTAVELDRDLVPLLQQKFAAYEGFNIHQADALNFDFGTLAGRGPLRVIGNLPYNISTPLLFHLLQYRANITDMHFMLQKEVVERMAACAGEKAYGRLGIMCQYYCKVYPLFDVPPGAFRPVPKVDSAIVKLVPHKTLPVVAHDEKVLNDVVRAVFQMRRKTLRNGLKHLLGPELPDNLPVDLGLRPEVLSIRDFVNLANAISDNDNTEEQS